MFVEATKYDPKMNESEIIKCSPFVDNKVQIKCYGAQADRQYVVHKVIKGNSGQITD